MTERDEKPGLRLAVFGSRTLADERVDGLINDAAQAADVIVTAGEPAGVCQRARDYAQRTGKPLHLYFLHRWRAQGMHHWRSVAVYENCDKVLIIHDGTSQGTRNELELARKMGVPVAYHQLEPLPAAPLPKELKDLLDALT